MFFVGFHKSIQRHLNLILSSPSSPSSRKDSLGILERFLDDESMIKLTAGSAILELQWDLFRAPVPVDGAV